MINCILNGKATITFLTVGLIKRQGINEWIFSRTKTFRNLLKKVDLANLNSNIVKLEIDKLKNVPTILSNLKSILDKLDVDKLVPVPFDLSKLNDAAKKDVVKKYVYNSKIKNIGYQIPDITNLATKTTLNVKTNEVKCEIPNINNLATNASLYAKIN